MILATDLKGAIGVGNKLLAYLEKDLAYFQKVTDGHIVIMGRKTFESLPKNSRPLPNRVNFIVSKSHKAKSNEKVFSSIEQALDEAKKLAKETKQKIFIIGGGSVYDYCIENDLVDVVYLTMINKDFSQVFKKEKIVYLKSFETIKRWTNLYSQIIKDGDLSTTRLIFIKQRERTLNN